MNARRSNEMRIEAYLFFPGTTEEAMGFYRDVFGGELTITRRGDVDPSASEAEKGQVINALLHSPDLALRASDAPNATREKQTRVALSVMGPDESRLRAVFDALTAGGTIDAPLERQFWGDTFGAITDRYGISWQVNIEAQGS
jgi:PhnB protein